MSIEADETSSTHFTKQSRFLDRLLRHLNRRFPFLRGASNQDRFGLLCMAVRELGMTLDRAFRLSDIFPWTGAEGLDSVTAVVRLLTGLFEFGHP